MEYRTTVETEDDQDYLPELVASVEDDGTLVIHHLNGEVEHTYKPDEWTSFTVEKADNID